MGQQVVLIWYLTNATWRQFGKLLVDVWSCQACSKIDHHLSYLWPSVL
jgi:hypothetical protein